MKKQCHICMIWKYPNEMSDLYATCKVCFHQIRSRKKGLIGSGSVTKV